jgi:hypothetical protein
MVICKRGSRNPSWPDLRYFSGMSEVTEKKRRKLSIRRGGLQGVLNTNAIGMTRDSLRWLLFNWRVQRERFIARHSTLDYAASSCAMQQKYHPLNGEQSGCKRCYVYVQHCILHDPLHNKITDRDSCRFYKRPLQPYPLSYLLIKQREYVWSAVPKELKY